MKFELNPGRPVDPDKVLDLVNDLHDIRERMKNVLSPNGCAMPMLIGKIAEVQMWLGSYLPRDKQP